MDKVTKDKEKFSIDILKHFKELSYFTDEIIDNNIFCISNEDIESTKRLVSKLEYAISKLNPTQKELIKLRYIDHLDWDFISESISCSKRTAHNRNKEVVSIIVQTLFNEIN